VAKTKAWYRNIENAKPMGSRPPSKKTLAKNIALQLKRDGLAALGLEMCDSCENGYPSHLLGIERCPNCGAALGANDIFAEEPANA
jgi:hypothetical protein